MACPSSPVRRHFFCRDGRNFANRLSLPKDGFMAVARSYKLLPSSPSLTPQLSPPPTRSLARASNPLLRLRCILSGTFQLLGFA